MRAQGYRHYQNRHAASNHMFDVIVRVRYVSGEAGNTRIRCPARHGRTAGFRHPSLMRNLVKNAAEL